MRAYRRLHIRLPKRHREQKWTCCFEVVFNQFGWFFALSPAN